MRLLQYLVLLGAFPCYGQVFTLLPQGNYVTQPKWDDSMVPAMFVKTGVNAPSWGTFGTNGALGVYLFQASSQNDQVWFGHQRKHAVKEGSSWHPHIHWCRTAAPGSASATNVVFGLEYSWANIGSVFPPSTTIYITNSVASANWTHQLTEWPEIDGTGSKLSAITICRFFRYATNDSDSYDQDIAFIGWDAHEIYDSIGSTEEVNK